MTQGGPTGQRLFRAAVQAESLAPFEAHLPLLHDPDLSAVERAGIWKAMRHGLAAIPIAYTADRIIIPASVDERLQIGEYSIRHRYADDFGPLPASSEPVREQPKSLRGGNFTKGDCRGLQALSILSWTLQHNMKNDLRDGLLYGGNAMRYGGIALGTAVELLLETVERGVAADLHKVPSFYLDGASRMSQVTDIFYHRLDPKRSKPNAGQLHVSMNNPVRFSLEALRNVMEEYTKVPVVDHMLILSTSEMRDIAASYDPDEVAQVAVQQMYDAGAFADRHAAHLNRALVTQPFTARCYVEFKKNNNGEVDRSSGRPQLVWPSQLNRPPVTHLTDVLAESDPAIGIGILQPTNRCPAAYHPRPGEEDAVAKIIQANVLALNRSSLLDPVTFITPPENSSPAF